VDGHGVPLSLVVTGANRHDVTQVEAVLEGIVVPRPEPDEETPHNLCADAGYVGEPAKEIMKQHHYVAHVRPRGEEKKELVKNPDFVARRWVVEACHSWLNRFRKLLVRYEKKAENYEALCHLACAIIAWCKVGVVYG
jgi:transposase